MDEKTDTPTAAPGNPDAPVTAPPTQRKAWIAGLEGPRGFGAVCIIFAHVAVVYTPGIVETTRLDFMGQALTFFFVLSGFLLYLPYVKRFVDGKDAPDTRKYFTSRVRRVFPAYLVIFLIVNFVLRAGYVQNPVVGGWDHSDTGTGMITDPIKLLAHVTLTQSLFPSTLQTGINPAWSLTTEWGFYLILPLAGYLMFRAAKGGPRPIAFTLVPAAALIALGLVTNTIVGFLQRGSSGLTPLEQYWGPNWIAVLSRSFLALADNFAWGMVAAVVYVAITKGAFPKVSTQKLMRIFTVIMVVALIGSMLAFVLGSRYISSIFAVSSFALVLMIVAPLGRGEDSKLARITDWRPFKFLGTISLSAYLWHYPVLIMVGRSPLDIPSNVFGLLLASALVLLFTFLLAVITYHLVEKPAMKWRA